MPNTYNVGWLKDEENQIFIPFTYTKSVKLNDNGDTLDSVVNLVNTNQDNISDIISGTQTVGVATKANSTKGILTVGNSTFNGSNNVTITAKDLGLTGALVYKGISTSEITDGGTETPTINGTAVTMTAADAGNIVLYKNASGKIFKEFVWTGTAWELLGDEGSYALKTITIGAGDGLEGGGSLNDNIDIAVNPDGITVTINSNKEVALVKAAKNVGTFGQSSDINNLEPNGATQSFKVPSIKVDEYGRVVEINEKNITLITDSFLSNQLNTLDDAISEIIKDIENEPSETHHGIVPRLSNVEDRTKYLDASLADDTFYITDGTGNVGFKVDADGKSYSMDFITDTGVSLEGVNSTVNTNSDEIATIKSTYKVTQSTVSSPTASGTTNAFIDTITQDAQGKITATKKTVRTMGAATASAAGSTGLVPAPGSGKNTSFLRGDATWVAPADSTSAAALGKGSSLVTERDVYYGLPTINNAHNYNSGTTLFAPTSGGTNNYLLKSNGSTSAPTWIDPRTLKVGSATSADSATSAGKLTNAQTIELTGSVSGSATFSGDSKCSITTSFSADSSLSTTSTNPVQNKVVTNAINGLNTLVGNTAVSTQISNALANYVPKTRTINGKALNANITLSASDVGALSSSYANKTISKTVLYTSSDTSMREKTIYISNLSSYDEILIEFKSDATQYAEGAYFRTNENICYDTSAYQGTAQTVPWNNTIYEFFRIYKTNSNSIKFENCYVSANGSSMSEFPKALVPVRITGYKYG